MPRTAACLAFLIAAVLSAADPPSLPNPFFAMDTGTRDERHRELARELGAEWAGAGDDMPPEELDAAIIFAPAGELVVAALRVLKKGGTVALGGIYMSPIPAMDYNLLYHERVIRSVANNTRKDGEEFLKIAAQIPIHTQVQEFPLADANHALRRMKQSEIRASAVLMV